MAKYAIWNKKDLIITPIGEVLTPEQWIERYPVAGIESITVVCSAGEINGAFFGTLGQMVDLYTKRGCDFYLCETAEDKLEAIENFEKEKEVEAIKAAEEAKAKEEANEASLASIAASMEFQNMMLLDDVEV